MSDKRVFILGAGSSKGHSKGVFPGITEFFAKAKTRLQFDLREEFKPIERYARKTFGWHVWQDESCDIEALFTHLEIELDQRRSSELLSVREQLLKFIHEVLLNLAELVEESSEYDELTRQENPRLRSSDTIITFNWDLLLDDLLNREQVLETHNREPEQQYDHGHYGRFTSMLSGWGKVTGGSRLSPPYQQWDSSIGYYLKAHGSIDWFFCSNESCRRAHAVFPVQDPRKTHFCAECHDALAPLLIPPALNKVHRQYPLLRRIWGLAAQELRSAIELVIWGYSLPPTDFHAAWLLRQAREGPLEKLILIDPQAGAQKFVRHFSELFKGKLQEGAVIPYQSFGDYCKNKPIPTPEMRFDPISAAEV